MAQTNKNVRVSTQPRGKWVFLEKDEQQQEKKIEDSKSHQRLVSLAPLKEAE